MVVVLPGGYSQLRRTLSPGQASPTGEWKDRSDFTEGGNWPVGVMASVEPVPLLSFANDRDTKLRGLWACRGGLVSLGFAKTNR
jgi:hypothetical protein